MEFKDFLKEKYKLSDKSAQDYVGRFNGIVNNGIYNGEKELTLSLLKSIEEKYPNSTNHYIKAMERFITFKKESKKLFKS